MGDCHFGAQVTLHMRCFSPQHLGCAGHVAETQLYKSCKAYAVVCTYKTAHTAGNGVHSASILCEQVTGSLVYL